jgi:methionyl-tRNA formyltransferase
VDEVYNLIRGTNPQPGAWTRFEGKTLQIYDSAKIPGGTGAPGEVTEVSQDGFKVAAKGGAILVKRVRPQGEAKMAAAEFATGAGLAKGARLG